MKLALGIFVGTIVVVMIMLLHILFIPPLGTDSLIYHLTIPAFWMQNGFFQRIDLPFHDGAAEYSPMLTQLMQYLLMRIFNNDSFAWLVQISFGFFTYLFYYKSSYLILKKSHLSMLLTSCILLFSPYISSMELANNDMALTCGGAWMLYGFTLFIESERKRIAIINIFSGICLLLLTKTVGVIYVISGIITFSFLIMVAKDRRSYFKGSNILIITFLLILGSVFYIKNLILYNNPFYPVKLSLFGSIIFPGVYDSSNFFDIEHSIFQKLYISMFNGNGAFNLIFPINCILWVSCIVFALKVITKKKMGLNFFSYLLFFVISIILFSRFVPFWYECRLLFPLYYTLWLFLPYAILGFDRIKLGSELIDFQLPIILIIFILELVANGLIENLCIAVFYIVLIVFSWLFYSGKFSKLNQLWKTLIMAGVCLLFFFWYALDTGLMQSLLKRRENSSNYYSKYYGELGAGWNFVDKISSGHPLNIAYSGTPIVFPLFGDEIKNKLFYIPISLKDRVSYVNLNNISQKDPHLIYKVLAEKRRGFIDEALWINSLKNNKIDIIFLVNDDKVGGTLQELEAIQRNPNLFSLLCREGNVIVYMCNFHNRLTSRK